MRADPARVESGWRQAALASRGPGQCDPSSVGGTSVVLSGGVAPGYFLAPLRGTKNPPLGLAVQHPFLTSRIARFSAIHAQNDSGGPLYFLENSNTEILRFAQDDSTEEPYEFFRSL